VRAPDLSGTHTRSFTCDGDPRDLPSFPTRRSSDLRERDRVIADPDRERVDVAHFTDKAFGKKLAAQIDLKRAGAACASMRTGDRSEEHTSELQSRENLVCRLLLEKKKPATSSNPKR